MSNADLVFWYSLVAPFVIVFGAWLMLKHTERQYDRERERQRAAKLPAE